MSGTVDVSLTLEIDGHKYGISTVGVYPDEAFAKQLAELVMGTFHQRNGYTLTLPKLDNE